MKLPALNRFPSHCVIRFVKGGFESSRPFCATSRRNNRAMLQVDMMVALALIVVALVPLSAGFFAEQKVLRSHYWRAAAMELVDGEMEILVAGEWRAHPEGAHPYPMKSHAITNLPPGLFTLNRKDRVLRLEWNPERDGSGGSVVREAVVP